MKPYRFGESGQRSCRCPPTKKSAIKECDSRAIRYGRAFLRYLIRNGTEITIAIIREWVGPRCAIPSRRSASGRIERTIISGRVVLTLSILAEDHPSRYAKAMCPTANKFISLKMGYLV